MAACQPQASEPIASGRPALRPSHSQSLSEDLKENGHDHVEDAHSDQHGYADLGADSV